MSKPSVVLPQFQIRVSFQQQSVPPVQFHIPPHLENENNPRIMPSEKPHLFPEARKDISRRAFEFQFPLAHVEQLSEPGVLLKYTFNEAVAVRVLEMPKIGCQHLTEMDNGLRMDGQCANARDGFPSRTWKSRRDAALTDSMLTRYGPCGSGILPRHAHTIPGQSDGTLWERRPAATLHPIPAIPMGILMKIIHQPGPDRIMETILNHLQ